MAESPRDICTCGHRRSDHDRKRLDSTISIGMCHGPTLALDGDPDGGVTRRVFCHCRVFTEAEEWQLAEWAEQGVPVTQQED